MSQIFKEYAQIMADKGLVKTADKKDPDYNVIPDKAGPDTPVENDGWELVEIAHPDQVQVANSRLNDGIVENIVDAQKIMLDVTIRTPRGVLAEVMQALVKAANVLEDDMTDESLKMAKEIDVMLEKLADGPIGGAAKGLGYGVAGKWMVKKVWDAAKGVFKNVKVPVPAAAAVEAPAVAGGAAAVDAAAVTLPATPAAIEAAEPAAASRLGQGAAAAGRMLTMPLTGAAIPAAVFAGIVADAAVVDWAVNHNLDNVYEQMTKVASDLDDLDVPAGSAMDRQVKEIAGKLNTYSGFKNELAFDTPRNAYMSFQNIEQVYNFINKMTPVVSNIIKNSDQSALDHIKVWKASKSQTQDGWNELVKLATEEYNSLKGALDAAARKYMPAAGTSPASSSLPVAINPEAKKNIDHASKAPSSHHNYSVGGPNDLEGSDLVKELQKALGVEQDGKFGPQTFAAVMKQADENGANNYNLKAYLDQAPHYAKSYQNWDKSAVAAALHNMQQFTGSPQQNSSSKALPPLIPAPQDTKDQVLDPYSAEHMGWTRK